MNHPPNTISQDSDQPRRAFLEFQGALMNLQVEMRKVEMSWLVLFEWQATYQQCRRFFDAANRDLFHQQPAEPVMIEKGER